MKLTKEQLEKAKTAKNPDELLALAKENGMEMTRGEAGRYLAILGTPGELTDSELADVSGGCGEPEKPIYTAMLCDRCGCNTFWNGDYVNGQKYKCPMCGEPAFHGTHTTDYLNW